MKRLKMQLFRAWSRAKDHWQMMFAVTPQIGPINKTLLI